jgi:hypothetical protein
VRQPTPFDIFATYRRFLGPGGRTSGKGQLSQVVRSSRRFNSQRPDSIFSRFKPLEHGREAAVDKLVDPSLEVFLVPTGRVGARRREV